MSTRHGNTNPTRIIWEESYDEPVPMTDEEVQDAAEAAAARADADLLDWENQQAYEAFVRGEEYGFEDPPADAPTPPQEHPRSVNVGDYVQWESQGVQQFK